MLGLYFMQYWWDLARIMPALGFLLKNHESYTLLQKREHICSFLHYSSSSVSLEFRENNCLCFKLFCIQVFPNWKLHVHVLSYDGFTYQSLSLQLKMHILGM